MPVGQQSSTHRHATRFAFSHHTPSVSAPVTTLSSSSTPSLDSFPPMRAGNSSLLRRTRLSMLLRLAARKPRTSRSTSKSSHQGRSGILAPTSRQASHTAAAASSCGWWVSRRHWGDSRAELRWAMARAATGPFSGWEANERTWR